MKFGVNTFIWSDHFDRSHVPLLPPLKKAGFDGVELPLIELNPRPDPDVRRALQENGLACTFCSIIPQGMSTVNENIEIRRKTREHLQTSIRTAAEMGSQLVAGPLYTPVGYLPGRRRTLDEWKRAVEFYQELGPALDESNVTIAIEPLNRYETYFLNTAADAAQLCQEINHPKVGVLFDTYHANIEEKHVADGLHAAAPYLRHVHSCENDRGIPGTGHIEWDSFFETLTAAHYDGWLTIEGFGFSLGALSAAASIWRDLAPTSDAIAFNGLKFLKEHATT